MKRRDIGENPRDTSYKKSASLPKGNKVAEINAEKKSAKYSIRSPCMIF
jgi:hypothetical protein